MSSPSYSRVDWSFFFLWVIVTFASTVLWFIIRALLHLGFFEIAWLVVDVVTIPLALLFMGVFVCVGQWLILRRYVSQASHWVWLSISGWVVGLPLAMYIIQSPYLHANNEIGWAISGTTMGIAQWLFLQSRVKNAGWWIPVSTISWLLGMLLIEAEFAGGWSGIVFLAVTTGLAMMQLLRYHIERIQSSVVQQGTPSGL